MTKMQRFTEVTAVVAGGVLLLCAVVMVVMLVTLAVYAVGVCR